MRCLQLKDNRFEKYLVSTVNSQLARKKVSLGGEKVVSMINESVISLTFCKFKSL